MIHVPVCVTHAFAAGEMPEKRVGTELFAGGTEEFKQMP